MTCVKGGPQYQSRLTGRLLLSRADRISYILAHGLHYVGVGAVAVCLPGVPTGPLLLKDLRQSLLCPSPSCFLPYPCPVQLTGPSEAWGPLVGCSEPPPMLPARAPLADCCGKTLWLG